MASCRVHACQTVDMMSKLCGREFELLKALFPSKLKHPELGIFANKFKGVISIGWQDLRKVDSTRKQDPVQ
eukprot:3666006-Karenia_brevis.AAC.1